MRTFLSTTALLAAMTAANAASAQGITGDWYASVFGGFSVPSDLESSYSYSGYTVELEQELDNGYMLGVTLGTSVAPNLRAEAELSYSKYEGGDLSGSYGGYSYTYSGEGIDAEATYLMANLWLDLPNIGEGSSAVPYVGGGIGGARLELENDGDSVDDTVFAYQLGAGIRIPAGPGMIDIGYRFKGTDEPEFSDSGITIELDEVYTNTLQVGYVLKF